MFSILLSLLFFAQSPVSASRTWDVDGVKREAIVHVPAKKSDAKLPLVFDFHGHGGTAKNAARTHHIHETWPEAVVVYMQGLNTPGKLTDPEGKKSGWQSGPGDQKDRDLKFFDAVLTSMKKDYPIDENRILRDGPLQRRRVHVSAVGEARRHLRGVRAGGGGGRSLFRGSQAQAAVPRRQRERPARHVRHADNERSIASRNSTGCDAKGRKMGEGLSASIRRRSARPS